MHWPGSTTLVTGASNGIGEAFAREVGRRGSHLVLAARSAGALDRIASNTPQRALDLRPRHASCAPNSHELAAASSPAREGSGGSPPVGHPTCRNGSPIARCVAASDGVESLVESQ